MLETSQKRWKFVHPLELSGREVPRRQKQQPFPSKSRSEISSSQPPPTFGSRDERISLNEAAAKGAKLSAVEAARARFLQRKKEGA